MIRHYDDNSFLGSSEIILLLNLISIANTFNTTLLIGVLLQNSTVQVRLPSLSPN